MSSYAPAPSTPSTSPTSRPSFPSKPHHPFLFLSVSFCPSSLNEFDMWVFGSFLRVIFRKMTGLEYMLSEVMALHSVCDSEAERDGPEKVSPMLTYSILDGSIYQAPQLCNIFAARMGRALYDISKAFNIATSRLEKLGYDAENKDTSSESKTAEETNDIKELK
ncbi:mediator of RNA polymerase II transcription subunit 6-like [Phoenix dactylifera]|uniref:Mediator of RNA polymerase II transcription subunit 6 n=1 Tax=Phoenix dactylifera TaxID=42345 RepID=A0A8B9AC27_PHODC|nr:mediator of RNA polymerase II transcription subunit 6-like [Phoenix dactylifera]